MVSPGIIIKGMESRVVTFMRLGILMIGYISFQRRGSLYIIGENFMLIRIIIISMLLFSCSFKGKQRDYIPKENNTPIVSTKQIYNYDQELFGVSINYKIPYNNFVFYRHENFFKASLSMTMQIYDINNDMILTQESWFEDIIVNSYEITRSFEEQYEFDKIIYLFSGEYE